MDLSVSGTLQCMYAAARRPRGADSARSCVAESYTHVSSKKRLCRKLCIHRNTASRRVDKYRISKSHTGSGSSCLARVDNVGQRAGDLHGEFASAVPHPRSAENPPSTSPQIAGLIIPTYTSPDRPASWAEKEPLGGAYYTLPVSQPNINLADMSLAVSCCSLW